MSNWAPSKKGLTSTCLRFFMPTGTLKFRLPHFWRVLTWSMHSFQLQTSWRDLCYFVRHQFSSISNHSALFTTCSAYWHTIDALNSTSKSTYTISEFQRAPNFCEWRARVKYFLTHARLSKILFEKQFASQNHFTRKILATTSPTYSSQKSKFWSVKLGSK